MNYTAPTIKPDKGQFMGSCNRTACQAPGADWYNRGTFAYYCEQCARLINRNPTYDGLPLLTHGKRVD